MELPAGPPCQARPCPCPCPACSAVATGPLLLPATTSAAEGWQDMACATLPSATTSGAQRERTGGPSPADMLCTRSFGRVPGPRHPNRLTFPRMGGALLPQCRPPFQSPATTSLQILVLFLAGHTWSPPSAHPTQGLFLQGPGPGEVPSRSLHVKSLSSPVPWRHPTVHPAKATLCDEAFRTPTTLPAHCPNVH